MNESQVIRVRFWAAARAAAGVAEHAVAVDAPVVLDELTRRVLAELTGEQTGERLAAVLSSCSVLVGERPVSSQDPADVQVRPGDTVEFLPPFAGG
ncbi:MoaD/ThiS family protein [Nocardioides sp.]|uniref:MoaD/ThiS family protein n=1 Tax=Nocardioides sp. TaxID=35761 RepID=UPI003515A530